MIRQMSQADALDELKDMTAWQSHPQLTEPQLLRILGGVRCQDADSRVPTDADWVPTYELDIAACEAWRRKAGLVAGDYNFGDANSRLERSQVLKHCLQMCDYYSKRIAPHPTRTGVSMNISTRSEEFEALLAQEELEI